MNKLLLIQQQFARLRAWHGIVFFLVLVAPLFFSGFHSDDFFQLLLLRGDGVIQRHAEGSFFGLFSFIDTVPAHRQQLQLYGVLPWFSADDFYFRFWRPLSELTHYLDFIAFSEQAWFAHWHSVAWYLLLSYLVYRFALVCSEQRKDIAGLAWLIFLIDGQHVANIGWIANRNSLIAVTFSLLSLLCYASWSNTRQWRFYLLSVITFALALCSAEIALGVIAYLFFYAVIIRQDSIVGLIKQASAYLVVLGLWFLFYSYYQYGVNTSSGLYINPQHEWMDYIAAIFLRVPIYIVSSLLPFPAGFSWVGESFVKGVQWLTFLFSILFSALLVFGLCRIKGQGRHFVFLVVASIFCLLPVCATLPQDRLALLQTVGIDIALSLLIFYLYEKSTQHYRAIAIAVILFIHIVLSPLHLLLGSAYLTWAAKNIEDNALSLDTDIHKKVMIVFRAPIGEAVSLMGIRAVHHALNPQQLLWLSNDEALLEIKQESKKTLIAIKPSGFASGLESAFRSVALKPFLVAEKINIGDIIIEVLAVSKEGYPTKIRLIFAQNIDSGQYQFYSYEQNQFKRLALAQLAAIYQ